MRAKPLGMVKDEEMFIFRKMVDGDKDAFRFFFEKYYSDLCNFVNLYLNDSMMSEEIAQDIFIYFWEKREIIQITSSVKSYLLRASKNKSLNHIRNEKTKLEIHERLAAISRDNSDVPDSILDANQLRELIEKAVENLPERCREVYILGKERGLSYAEISEELDISVKTVEAQMGKALKKLREQLRPHYNDIFTLFMFWILK